MPDLEATPILNDGGKPFLRSRAGIALLAFGGIAAFFLIVEHRAHALGALPLLLACPLMHIFMHRGRGDQAGHVSDSPQAAHRESPATARATASGAPEDSRNPRGPTP